MYLKEAFRYQNYLDDLVNKTIRYLSDPRIFMKTVQNHMKHKVNFDAQDETIDMTTERSIEYSANELIEFLTRLCEEKEKLTFAISDAKKRCPLDIDAEVANNKTRQRIASVFSDLGGRKSSERKSRGTDYKFNAEGNQVAYYYDVVEVSTIDFDRNVVKANAKNMVTKADEISTAIDKVMVEIEVEYDHIFSVNDTYEDAIEKFISMKNENLGATTVAE